MSLIPQSSVSKQSEIKMNNSGDKVNDCTWSTTTLLLLSSETGHSQLVSSSPSGKSIYWSNHNQWGQWGISSTVVLIAHIWNDIDLGSFCTSVTYCTRQLFHISSPEALNEWWVIISLLFFFFSFSLVGDSSQNTSRIGDPTHSFHGGTLT